MPYDVFISYAHQGDNTSREAVAVLVARLHAELEADFRHRYGRDPEIFFDKEDIKDFDHWQVRCHRALRDSRFFIACLSRSYLHSDACRWEWEEWCWHELENGLVGQDAALLRRWKSDLLQRFHFQCHERRHDHHGNFLDAAALSELQQLIEHVAQRLRLLTLDHARRGNLPWPKRKLRRARTGTGQAVRRVARRAGAIIHGVGGMGKTALAQAFAYKEANAFPAVAGAAQRGPRPAALRTPHARDRARNRVGRRGKAGRCQGSATRVRRVPWRGPALFLLDHRGQQLRRLIACAAALKNN